ncbi:ABC transporter permease [Stenotrophomonas sp.]|uniref:ABC transporter permease n=1 Tax=Stenotrophomonas sp. TaxID=69392 RepID=UPI0028B04DD6|nr:ABC transporter permease [Stenotrophomonas sp.]
MNRYTLQSAATVPSTMSTRSLAGAYLHEIRAECLRYLRSPGFLLPTLLFPAAFYLMFAVMLGKGQPADAARFLLGSYVTFGVMAPGLFGFGMSLALERDNGLLTLKRALPMPPLAYLLGKMVMAMMMALAIVSVLQLLAVGVAGVHLSAWQSLRLMAVATFGTLPFCALGLLLGTLVKGNGAPAVINLIYLPMAVLSGLWFPLKVLPPVLRDMAVAWPSYHLNALAQTALDFPAGAAWPHVTWLVVFTLVVTALAAWRLRRHG